ncbi:MAG: hypothetical protein H6745_19795 [Deltaproteobacteria bacterium]|nr:hypothetical protein [Deltaproteobacteria bacterium]
MSPPRVVAAADLETLVALISDSVGALSRPCVVALDGRSGAGKSTLAARLAAGLGGVVLDGDGFFAGGVTVRSDSPEDRALDCVDWRRQRDVLATLRAGRVARYHAFDWEAFDGRLEATPTAVEPAQIIVFEGVYSARPELHDLVDLRLLLRVDDATRAARLLAREGAIGPWERQWHEAEDHYFGATMPVAAFDAIVDGA